MCCTFFHSSVVAWRVKRRQKMVQCSVHRFSHCHIYKIVGKRLANNYPTNNMIRRQAKEWVLVYWGWEMLNGKDEWSPGYNLFIYCIAAGWLADVLDPSTKSLLFYWNARTPSSERVRRQLCVKRMFVWNVMCAIIVTPSLGTKWCEYWPHMKTTLNGELLFSWESI